MRLRKPYFNSKIRLHYFHFIIHLPYMSFSERHQITIIFFDSEYPFRIKYTITHIRAYIGLVSTTPSHRRLFSGNYRPNNPDSYQPLLNLFATTQPDLINGPTERLASVHPPRAQFMDGRGVSSWWWRPIRHPNCIINTLRSLLGANTETALGRLRHPTNLSPGSNQRLETFYRRVKLSAKSRSELIIWMIQLDARNTQHSTLVRLSCLILASFNISEV